MSLGRQIARCFITPCDEKEETKKFIPNTSIEYKREVKDAFGNSFAYEQKDGNWVTVRPGRQSKSGALHCSNDGDASFEAIQALDYPRFNGSTGL